MNAFSDTSLLMSASREERLLIAGSMLEPDISAGFYDHIFSAHLKWPWIIMQAMQHRVLCTLWEKLKRDDLMKAAIRSGLTKNWIAYAEQLCRASLKRNLLWLKQLDAVFEEASRARIPLVCIKGSALIGDVYHPGNRMLGDIDTLVPVESRRPMSELLHRLGFQHGNIDPVTSKVKPLSDEKQRFWSFHSHLMPKFNLETGDPDVPFLRLAVGFDFFDPQDKHSVPSDVIVSRRVRKASHSQAYIPDAADMVINLCAHIYREAISATFGFVGENWHLWKFCDLRSYLLKHGCEELKRVLSARVDQLGLTKPCYFALHYTQKVYGDPELEQWASLCNPGDDEDFLYELVEGKRRARCDVPFGQRLFDLGQTLAPGASTSTWARVMNDGDEWW